VSRYVVIENGGRTCIRYTLKQAAERIAAIHEAGGTWDARVKTTGQGYRILKPDEAAVLIAAVKEEL
jgi:hypothetical protein